MKHNQPIWQVMVTGGAPANHFVNNPTQFRPAIVQMKMCLL
jgi:hypothetical protein